MPDTLRKELSVLHRTRHTDNYNDRVIRAALEGCTCYRRVEEEGVKSTQGELRRLQEQVLKYKCKCVHMADDKRRAFQAEETVGTRGMKHCVGWGALALLVVDRDVGRNKEMVFLHNVFIL